MKVKHSSSRLHNDATAHKLQPEVQATQPQWTSHHFAPLAVSPEGQSLHQSRFACSPLKKQSERHLLLCKGLQDPAPCTPMQNQQHFANDSGSGVVNPETQGTLWLAQRSPQNIKKPSKDTGA